MNPPASARSWVNWFWLDGNITREGITADLEAMQRVGIGGVLLMDIAQDIPPGPVPFGGAEWRALFKHTVSEADRLGLQVSIHNAPGWCGSGGPWITPDLAMRKVVSSRTNVSGPLHFSARLPPLPSDNGFGHDIAVLAFPTLVGEGAPVPGFAPKIISSGPDPIEGARLLDNNPQTFVKVPVPSRGKTAYLQLEFTEPFTASFLRLIESGRPQRFQGRLQISANGRTFQDVREFMSSDKGLALPFETVSARYFRILFTKADPRLDHLEFCELELTPVFHIDSAQTKAGLGRSPSSPTVPSVTNVPAYAAISLQNIVNLAPQVTREGRLDWDIPKGLWTILRLGDIPTGQKNHPARAEGVGLECDKLSKEAMDAHFAAFLGHLISDVGSLAGKTFTATHIDSWENGFQNWTPRFVEEFRNRRGYDPAPYLPAFSGRIVASLDQSERFLWDVRRTIADLLADNYAGQLATLAHQHGLELSIEAYGNGPFDDLLYAGRADVPMAEFWLAKRDYSTFQNKAMPSAAHTYGKPVIAAEAFTSYPDSAKWQNHPYSLKALGDVEFCEGINRMVFHRYAHQPWLDRRPGMTMGHWGVHYERTETWWEFSKPWHEYLARCQYLLQSGLFVADICYLTDEGSYTEAPLRGNLQPAVPAGYDYDLATPEVILRRMSVKDGRLMLPDGMNYRVLVLPPGNTMTPALLTKIKELVDAGAVVVGTPPVKSPSLTDYPHCDVPIKQLAAELWGPCDGKSIKEHPYGKGKVVWPRPLDEVLRELRVPPDFEQLSSLSGSPLRRIHRRINGADFYFVADSNAQAQTADCLFRVTGQQPELWYPESGRIEKAAIWHEQKEGTTLSLKFNPTGSMFVVFRESSKGQDPVLSLAHDGKIDNQFPLAQTTTGQLEVVADVPGVYEAKTASGKTLRAEIDNMPKPFVLQGPWELQFPSRMGAPDHVILPQLISWTMHTNPGVKYFSGTVAYTKRFELPAGFLSNNSRANLDLGNVRVMARVELNGQDLGVLWRPPFTVDVTKALKTGDNQLEVDVVNLWPNRLIGDEQLPEDCEWKTHGADYGDPLLKWPTWLIEGKPRPTTRIAFTTWKHWHKDSPLVESGLLGPVTITAQQTAVLVAR